MTDRDRHNPAAPDQAPPVEPAEETPAPAEPDHAPAPEAEGPGAAGPPAQDRAEAGGEAEAAPAEVLGEMAGSVADEAADSIDQADDEIGRLIAEVEALTGSDEPPPADAPAADAAPSGEPAVDSAPAPARQDSAEGAPGPNNEDPGPGSQQTDPAAAGADQPAEGEAGEPAPEAQAAKDTAASEPDGSGGSGDPALSDIDEVLARDVEQLLDGNFEVVSGILDDVFDEHAIAVTDEDDSEAEAPDEDRVSPPVQADRQDQPPPAELGAAGDDQFAALTGAASFESVEEVVGSEDSPTEGPVTQGPAIRAEVEPEAEPGTGSAPPSTADSPAEPAEEGVTDRVATSDAEPAESASSHATPEGATTAADEPADATEDGAASAEGEPPAHVSELLPPRSSAETAADPADMRSGAARGAAEKAPPSPEAAEEPEERPIEASPAGGLRLLLSSLAPVVLPVLQAINYPLRFVPPPLRPLVDWVALSLVFWVPVVWIVALFLIGG